MTLSIWILGVWVVVSRVQIFGSRILRDDLSNPGFGCSDLRKFDFGR